MLEENECNENRKLSKDLVPHLVPHVWNKGTRAYREQVRHFGDRTCRGSHAKRAKSPWGKYYYSGEIHNRSLSLFSRGHF